MTEAFNSDVDKIDSIQAEIVIIQRKISDRYKRDLTTFDGSF